jgi:hypothetical protein
MRKAQSIYVNGAPGFKYCSDEFSTALSLDFFLMPRAQSRSFKIEIFLKVQIFVTWHSASDMHVLIDFILIICILTRQKIPFKSFSIIISMEHTNL